MDNKAFAEAVDKLYASAEKNGYAIATVSDGYIAIWRRMYLQSLLTGVNGITITLTVRKTVDGPEVEILHLSKAKLQGLLDTTDSRLVMTVINRQGIIN